MDTKWTKFKYSSFSKLLCALLACVMLMVSSINVYYIAKYNCLFYTSDLSGKNAVLCSRGFVEQFRSDMDLLINCTVNKDAVLNEIDNETNRAAAEAVEKFKSFKTLYENNYRISDDYYINDYAESYETTMPENVTSIYYNNYEYFYDDNGNPVFCISVDVKVGNDSRGVQITCPIRYTEEMVKEAAYDAIKDDGFLSAMKADYTSSVEFNQLDLKNLLYYAECSNGAIVTNVESKEALLENLESKTYFVSEKGELRYSDDLSYVAMYSNTSTPYNVYVVIDTSFSQDDHYSRIANNVYAVIDSTHIYRSIAVAAVGLLLALLFFVISIRLAGHTKYGIEAAFIDKVPYDIHLIFSGGAAAFLLLMALELADTRIGKLTYYDYVCFFPEFFINQPVFKITFWAFVCVAYLLILEFSTSVARGVKTGKNILKSTVIYKFFAVVVRKLAIIIRDIVKSIIYKPRHFGRVTIATILLYTLLNILATVFAIICICAKDAFAECLGVFVMLAMLALDGYLIYLVVKYLKSLDGIITAVENGEPVSENTELLPNSLKTLANSIDIANAQLQSAIIKAVADERTKAELITNVSHDLKTPLTSVINYIDLLKKCDIEDETAKEYMAVIDEKSIKLKRLIEDLIEASKLAGGNITLNKTKLNLGELATQAIVEEAGEFEKNNLQLIFDEPVSKHIAFADGTKVYRIFENLLSNAKKYSAPASRVYARLYSSGNFECFEIKNISKEQLNISASELTERFVRGDKSRSEDGNGLGLSIATELCRLNGGALEISIDGDLFKATVKLPKNETITD